jgi:hypothetical protein
MRFRGPERLDDRYGEAQCKRPVWRHADDLFIVSLGRAGKCRCRSDGVLARHSLRSSLREDLGQGRAPTSGERFEQRLGLLQVGHVGALGEPFVDRREEVVCFPRFALLLP